MPGAADNATGAAAVLTLGEAWCRRPHDGVELVLLLPGCEEPGMLGSAAWADRHREELSELPTFFLNIDNLGVGPVRFFGAEIPLLGWPVAYPRRWWTPPKKRHGNWALTMLVPTRCQGREMAYHSSCEVYQR